MEEIQESFDNVIRAFNTAVAQRRNIFPLKEAFKEFEKLAKKVELTADEIQKFAQDSKQKLQMNSDNEAQYERVASAMSTRKEIDSKLFEAVWQAVLSQTTEKKLIDVWLKKTPDEQTKLAEALNEGPLRTKTEADSLFISHNEEKSEELFSDFLTAEDPAEFLWKNAKALEDRPIVFLRLLAEVETSSPLVNLIVNRAPFMDLIDRPESGLVMLCCEAMRKALSNNDSSAAYKQYHAELPQYVTAPMEAIHYANQVADKYFPIQKKINHRDVFESLPENLREDLEYNYKMFRKIIPPKQHPSRESMENCIALLSDSKVDYKAFHAHLDKEHEKGNAGLRIIFSLTKKEFDAGKSELAEQKKQTVERPQTPEPKEGIKPHKE